MVDNGLLEEIRMITKEDLLERLAYQKKLSDEYLAKAKSLELFSAERNLAWIAHRVHDGIAKELESILESFDE